MRPVVIVMAVAVAAASLTALLAKHWVDRQTAKPVAEQTETMKEVLVVAHDVTSGTVLQSGDLRYDKWPQSAVSDRLIVRQDDADIKAQFVGQVARRALAEGEPVSKAVLFGTDMSGILAGMLAPGMRALSIAITNTSAVSGFITPGDRVDIVLAADFQNTVQREREKGEGSSVIQRYAAETVLTDVKVLAIDQQVARGHDGAAMQGKTATVEVTPKQAELLTAAELVGNLQLVLRGLPPAEQGPQTVAAAEVATATSAVVEPATTEPTANFTGDTQASKALGSLVGQAPTPAKKSSGGTVIHINRAGQISVEGGLK
jgi:pilus assembly protein CpaB